MNVTPLNFQLDQTGHCTYAVLNPKQKYKVELQNGTELSFTVPSESPRWTINFSYQDGSNTWVSINGHTSAVTTTITACEDELHPAQRVVQAGDVIRLQTFLTTDIVQWSLLACQ
ncbi:MAG: hypothetical protein E6R13_00700 [Spirochaetes bacterium]|nr:MAG: hypothetical protein E6R13_00700 [Spirochaetota bacterium]